MSDSEARQQLERLRLYFLRKKPFFYFLLSNMRITYDANSSSDIIVSDDGFQFSKKFINYSPEVKIRVITHALYHIIQRYPARRREYHGDKKAFDMAAAIRLYLDMPSGRSITRILQAVLGISNDDAMKMSVEEIARLLETKDYANIGLTLSEKAALDDARMEYGELGGEELQQASKKPQEDSQKWLNEVAVKAAVFAKLAGKSDPVTERLIDEILRVKISWEALLRGAISEGYGSKILNTYARMNRRISDLPGVRRWHKDVTVAVDVSGSIDDATYAKFISTIAALLNRADITFIAWDTQANIIGYPKTATELKKLTKTVKGYGGTQPDCLVPLLRRLNPRLTIILTDGYWGAWKKLDEWAKGKRVIVVSTEETNPEWRFWRIIKADK